MAGTLPPLPVPPSDFVNGPLYRAARFGAEYVNVPPSYHRLYNAIGLTAGLYLGRKMMDIMVGAKPDGTKIERDDVPAVLRPLHGILPYDHFSDNPRDRWMNVFDRLVPAAVGAMGACAGSAQFFSKDFIKPVEMKLPLSVSNPESFTLFDAERQALYHQSKPWSLMTGSSALFGSASGSGLFPSVGHYGADLGTLFAMRAERAPAPLGRLVNANMHAPFRPTKLVNNMIEYAARNPSAHPEQLQEYAHGILKTWFRGAKEEQVKAFTDLVNAERAKFLQDGKLPASAETAVRESLKKLISDVGMEKTLLKVGIDPREISFGDQGFISIISRTVGDALGQGTSKKLEESWKQAAKGLEIRNPELVGKVFDQTAHKFAPDGLQKAAAITAIGAGVGGVSLIGLAKDTDVGDIAKGKATSSASSAAANSPAAENSPGTDDPLTKFSHKVNGHKHALHVKRNHGFINGKLLDAGEGITDTFNVINGINSHRLYCAVGLSTGSWLGEEFMKALTGVSFTGAKVKQEDVLGPFKKLYKSLAFNPHSDLPHDKWMQVLRWIVPTAIGGAAIVTASNMYFHEREKKLKNAKYLDEVEQKATSAQAGPWTVGSAVTALFGGSSGFAWIPGINYMTHLGTRYSMASGRKVSMPYVGKVWSNNDTLFPFAPPGMIDLLIKESVNNKSYNPELLETYAIGVLKPWFDNVTPEQVEGFVNHVYEIRDRFYKEGGVPEDMKKQLEEQLKAHLKGAGLEETLCEVGLNPLDAHIANNGLSGQIAESLGAKRSIDKIKADYTASYLERLKNRQHGPSSGPSFASMSE